MGFSIAGAGVEAAAPGVDATMVALGCCAGGELSLKAANAAMLHQGAKGYLVRNPAQRRLREASGLLASPCSMTMIRRFGS